MNRIKCQPLGLDLSKPIKNLKNKKTCRGNLWNPTHPECVKCPSKFECCALYSFRVKNKTAKVESQEIFLDQLDFDKYDWADLIAKVESKDVKLNKVISKILEICKCPSEKLAELKIKSFCYENNLHLNSGKISKLPY